MNVQKPGISLCMIVKDEEEFIRGCLESVKSLISEAIVVDTGSTDRTARIAADCGATVLNFTWCDDFAAARNFSLSQASLDWILVLDADERIAPGDIAALLELTSDPSRCIQFSQRHYTDNPALANFIPTSGEFPEFEAGHLGFFESSCVRLFPNHKGIEFRGKVHELVEPWIREQNLLTVCSTEIRIHHFGHTAAVRQRKNKTPLYAALGAAKSELAPNDWKGFFELGVARSCASEFREAAHALRRSAELNPCHIDTHINLGQAYFQLEAYQNSIDSLHEALRIDRNSPEALCNLGVVYLRLGKFEPAEQLLRQAVSIKPNYINAICNLGQSLAHQRRFAEAAAQFERVVEIAPHFAVPLVDLGALHLQIGKFEQAEQYLRRALEIDGTSIRAKLTFTELLEATGRKEEAALQRKALSVLSAADPIIISGAD